MVKFPTWCINDLLVQPKTKAAKAAGELSETAKKVVFKVWLKNNLKMRDAQLFTKEIEKGNSQEVEGAQLVSWFRGEKIEQYKGEYLQNDYITGMPDHMNDEYGGDFKLPYTVPIFLKKPRTLEVLLKDQTGKQQYGQCQGYMWMSKRPMWYLWQCGINTDMDTLNSHCLRKLSYVKFDNESDYKKEYDKIMRLHSFDLLPLRSRVIEIEIPYDAEYIEKLKVAIDRARIYYNSLSLPNT